MNPDLLTPSEAIKENKFLGYVLIGWIVILNPQLHNLLVILSLERAMWPAALGRYRGLRQPLTWSDMNMILNRSTNSDPAEAGSLSPTRLVSGSRFAQVPYSESYQRAGRGPHYRLASRRTLYRTLDLPVPVLSAGPSRMTTMGAGVPATQIAGGSPSSVKDSKVL